MVTSTVLSNEEISLLDDLEAGGRRLDQAARKLYDQYFGMCKAFVLQNRGNIEDAADLFQEVVFSFIDNVQKGKFRKESKIKSFLYSMIRFQWLNSIKKQDRTMIRDTQFYETNDTVTADISGWLEERESQKIIFEVIGSLGETCSKILRLFYFEESSFEEIAEETGFKNAQNARNKKSKCMKGLMDMLDENQATRNALQTSLRS